ncbi:LysR family transcriptional regulator [Nocardioides insulae]|uniref:LysR family transcriptional regulator n=1 Tax=Nocardioides insulae TaxID=394734 RepID=UPI00146B6937|nr:LysR family transcriptional regulator [Nocardioides insulae]
MDPQHVRYFLAVVDQGSINSAAGAVGVAQPTISQALRTLERELRTPLFHRIGRGMVPTSAGHALVGPARKILRDMATAGGSIPDSEGHLRGRLDVRVQPALARGPLPKLVAAFHARHPRVEITLASLEDERRTAALIRDAVCEVVACHLPHVDPDSGRHTPLEEVYLGTQEYWLAFPPGHEAPAENPMRWSQMASPMVAVPQGGQHVRQIYRNMPTEQQHRPAAVMLANRDARLAFTLAGVAPTWIERSEAEMARQHGAEVRALTPPLPTRCGLVFEPETLSPAAAAFVAMARDHVGHEDGADPAAADPAIGSPTSSARNASPAGES